MPQFDEFISNFKLKEYPFSTFTTENEIGKEEDLFIKPNDYSPIIQAFNQKNTIILIGDRGTGKTAILLDFDRKLDKSNSIFCTVDDYSTLPNPITSIELYKFLVSKVSTILFEHLVTDYKRLKKINKEEKVLLSYLLKNFVSVISKRVLKEKIENIQIPWYKRSLIKTFNLFRKPINYSFTIGAKVLEEYITKHFKGLPSLDDLGEIKNIFPELPLDIDNDFNNLEVGYQLLGKVVQIAQKLGYDRIVLLLDKIDEDSRLENNGEAIADFIQPLLVDNKLLLNKDLQLIISMWSTPFNYLKENVRTQKHYCPVLQWTIEDLEKALNQRLSYFSQGIVVDFRELFSSEYTVNEFKTIFELANSNPRDLWHLFDKLLRNQFRFNPNANTIELGAFQDGINDFVANFNYFEYYPRKQNAKSNTMDFYSYTAHLLKLDNHIFTRNRLSEKAGTGGSTQNYVVGMERIGLVEKHGQESGATTYKIKDPKVVYALKNAIKIEKTG